MEPTVFDHPGFSAPDDGQALRAAMKGFGTDEQTIIDIMTSRSNLQRQAMAKFFTEEYGRSLIEDLKSELGGNFEDVIVALVLPPVEYLCKQLNKSMVGFGTDTKAIIEILCCRSKESVREIVETYERMFDRPLAEHVCSETSGDFRRLLTLIITGVRNNGGVIAPEAAEEQARTLFEAGEGKFGTSEEVFNKIFAHESFEQLKFIFEEYKKVSGHTIEQALRSEMSGELLEAFLAITEYVISPQSYFAKQIHHACEGFGTDDTSLIRIIVSRSEIDLGSIKREFERIYGKTLESVVKGETSGDYKKALIALIGGP